MITIKDIANEANVSEGTVDRVIHNRGGVSKKTEAKIRKIIENHKFSVNPVASALAMKKQLHIAVLIPKHNDSDLFWKSPYLGTLKASEELRTFGVNVTHFMFNQYDKASYITTFNALLKTKPSAVLMVPNFLDETKRFVTKLEKLEVPYLFLNINLDGFNNIAYVGQDSFTAGYTAGKLMQLSLNNESTFLIIQSRFNITENNAVSNRIEGFKSFFTSNNITHQCLTLKLENLNNTQNTKNIINTYLKEHPEIKGIFVPSSRIYIIVDCLDHTYLNNLQLIGFDNTPQNAECLLNNSVAFLISQKPFEQGYESFRVLADYLIKNQNPSRSEMYLPIEILTKENVKYSERNEFLFNIITA